MLHSRLSKHCVRSLCLLYLICISCGLKSDTVVVQQNEQIVLDEREKIFEGFLCSGTMWQVFIRDIKDLDKANKRYLADFSANGGEQREALTEMLREGVEIDWPTNRSQTRIIWAKIVAEEQMIGKGTSIGELNRGLRIKRVMRYSRTRVEEALKEASREGLKKGGV